MPIYIKPKQLCSLCKLGMEVVYCYHLGKAFCSRKCWELYKKSDEYKNRYQEYPEDRR